jgi:aryl-alcohol dehydrogenase-like predicted oxidoreductase
MNRRTLGARGPEVSAVGMGCMGLSHAYGPPTDRHEAVAILREAYDTGYTFFDTAEGYTGVNADGSTSSNEELVGEALQVIRGDVVIATKFGVRLTDSGLATDSRPETIRRSLEGSLRKLRTDHIDLYYQHRQDPATPIEEVAAVMQDLIQDGTIGAWGLSAVGEDEIRRAHAVCPVTAVQNRYSMMDRQQEALFPMFAELGIALVAYSPMANGFLTGRYGKGAEYDASTDYRSRMPQFSDDGVDANQDLLALLRRLAEEKSATPAQISLAWMLSKQPWIVPIPGTRKLARLRENAAAADLELGSDEVSGIDDALASISTSAVFGGSNTPRT